MTIQGAYPYFAIALALEYPGGSMARQTYSSLPASNTAGAPLTLNPNACGSSFAISKFIPLSSTTIFTDLGIFTFRSP